MNYLSVDLLSKSYGIKELFSDLSFGIDKGEKVGLIARNGSGKSTLLKVLVGKETPDTGNVVLRKGISTGFLPQEQDFDSASSGEEILYSGDHPRLNAIREYDRCMKKELEDSAMEAAFEEMNAQQAWDFEVKVNQVVTQLDIGDMQQAVGNMSGGQQKRLALAKVLIDEPDIMVLDEPTNHLDLEMIEWLENHLSRSSTTLLMVTHDRYFLETICTTILELDEGKLYRYTGNYSYFLEKKAQREEETRSNIVKAKNLMRKELEWMRRMPKARGTKSKARVGAFHGLKERASKKIKKEEVELNVKMDRLGAKIVEFHKVSKNFGDLDILKSFSYNFKRQEKLGIVGGNGTGKTTFLNLITELDQPNAGKVVIGETITFGYYRQEGIKLREDQRVIEVVKDIAEVIPMEGGRKLSASQMLERFLFTPEMQYQYVSTLSGGEKRRLFLLTVLMKNPNFLILDEPTNDLDITTMNVLEEYLENFQGCLVVVSHDRYFMDKIVDHLLVFNGKGEIKDILGNYSVWLEEQKAAKTHSAIAQQATSIQTGKPADLRQAPITRKLGFNEKREFGILEIEIDKLEKKKAELTNVINSGTVDHEELIANSEQLGRVTEQLNTKTDRWLELSEYDH